MRQDGILFDYITIMGHLARHKKYIVDVVIEPHEFVPSVQSIEADFKLRKTSS